MEHDALADLVVLTVKTTVAPLVERLAAAEARVAIAVQIEKSLTDLRDRLMAVETKTAMPPAADQAVRDRVLALETKAGAPLAADILLADVKARVAALESRPVVPPETAGEVTTLRDRIVVLETRTQTPDPALPRVIERLASLDGVATELQTIRERLITMDARASVPGPPGRDGADGRDVDDGLLRDLREKVDAVTKDVAGLRERVAVAEVRALVPGPPGKDGTDGADGMGWDDLAVKHDGERTFTVQLVKGERVKDAGTFSVPFMLYRGVYADGRTYEPGDAVTYAGSMWLCQKTTSVKPDEVTRALNGLAGGAQGKDFWAMVVKHGREGRPGKDGRDSNPLPIVSVGSRT